MHHFIVSGPPYEAGRRLGEKLRRCGQGPGDLPAAAMTKEKRDFARRCGEICAEEFPEAVQELYGLADGLSLPREALAGQIFCIYNYPPFQGCTCFAARSGAGVLLGRNSDFMIQMEGHCLSLEYRSAAGFCFWGNATAPVQLEDGMNSHGLAAGLTFVWPVVKRPGLNAGLLVRYLLQKCRTVKEGIAALKRLTISSAQTITLADAEGDMATVECNAARVEVLRPRAGEHFVAAVNGFCSGAMQPYAPAWDMMLSDQRRRTVCSALAARCDCDAAFARSLLAGEQGFLCQYDRALGADTLWSALYLPKRQQAFLCEGNPSRTPFYKVAVGAD